VSAGIEVMMTSANAKRERQPSFSPLRIAYLQKWIFE
jgi:hypothetical protein